MLNAVTLILTQLKSNKNMHLQKCFCLRMFTPVCAFSLHTGQNKNDWSVFLIIIIMCFYADAHCMTLTDI